MTRIVSITLGVILAMTLGIASASASELARNESFGTRGASFDRAWGTCDYHRQNHAVRVNCDANEQIAFRYVIAQKPTLLEGESITGQYVSANIEKFGGYGDTNVTRNRNKVRVYIDGTFNGLIHRVSRTFCIDTIQTV